MRIEKHLGQLRQLASQVVKRGSPGERVLGSLFPSRGTGWPGGWSQDRIEQVLHLKNWVFTAANIILTKMASILPNMAYVSHGSTGQSVKACQRSLYSLMGKGFGSHGSVGEGSSFSYGSGAYDASALAPHGGGSFLTVGEYRSKALSVVKPHEELEPIEPDHHLRQLIEDPNPFDTSFDLAYEKGMFEILTGVSYTWAVPNKWGVPAELWVIPSHWVWPRTGSPVPDGGIGRKLMNTQWDGGQEVGDAARFGASYVSPWSQHADQLIQYYEVRPWGGMGSSGILRIPPNEIITQRWKSPINKIDGYSPLAAGAQWIDSEESISKCRWSQFQNQARPEFWVKMPPGYEDPDDDRISRFEAKIAAKIQGEYNYGKPLITPNNTEVSPLSFNPTEMAYFQSMEQIRDMVLSLLAVPKLALGMSEGMTYGSVLAVLAVLCSNCINPRLTMSGLTWTKNLASRWDDRAPAYSTMTRGGYGGRASARKVKLWYDDVVPADPAQVNSDLQTDMQCYAVTPNEVRALRGRKPYRYGGDDPMVQGPGGIMPYPMNTKDDIEDLAKKVGEYAAAVQPQPEGGEEGGAGGLAGMLGGAGGGGGEEGGEGQEQPSAEEGSPDLQAALQQGEQEEMAEAGMPPAEPNGKPHKARPRREVVKGLADMARSFLHEKVAGNGRAH